MEAAYRTANKGFYSSDQFDRYEDLYSELSEWIVDSGEASVFPELVPLLESREFSQARELLSDELDLDEGPEFEEAVDVFYVDDEWYDE